MIMDFNIHTLTSPTEPWLEIPENSQAEAWQQSQSFSTPSSRWNAYINRLCLLAFLPWVEEELGVTATAFPNAIALPSFWEVVNGTAITVGEMRLVLIPTQAIDTSELRVPQEWVDIPSWVADYYIGVQVNTEEGYVRIWGYTSHKKLKAQGNYSERDRAYSLDATDLIADINLLWVERQLCPEAATKAQVYSLPTLELAQANNLIERLGNPVLTFVRRAVPFSFWGALLEHGGWRKRLYERRLGLPEQWSMLQWVQNGISDLAQQIGWNSLGFQASFGNRGTQTTDEPPVLSRFLIITGQQYELQISPVEDLAAGLWRFELCNLSLAGSIPSGLKLRLLTEDLQPFEDNERIGTGGEEKLEIVVGLEPGEGIVWEIEPTPENYDREILRF